jgi:energy-coupling factor transport system substrate-specific component/cob(I)alamin adenosyltransferase
VAILVAAQLCFSMLAGVEVVTVLFVAYAFVFGWKRGVIAAVSFSLLRQLVFGFFPQVLCLYLVYYPLLTLFSGCWGKTKRQRRKSLFR